MKAASSRPAAALTAVIAASIILSACCDKAGIPGNTKSLYSTEPRDKTKAAFALAKCGERASGAVARLGELLYDENVGVQSAAAYALRKIDTKQARAILKRAVDSRKNS